MPFLSLPDARRIDIRATLRDPFEGVHVRRFETRVPVEVYALVDLSASMRDRGEADRLALAAELCAGLAASATRIGDGFGLIAADGAIRADLTLPATRHRSAARTLAGRLAGAPCRDGSAEGMVAGAHSLLGRPKMVFVVSDFRWPADLIRRVFSALALHDTVPVLLADSAEDEGLPPWGLAELEDPKGPGAGSCSCGRPCAAAGSPASGSDARRSRPSPPRRAPAGPSPSSTGSMRRR